AAFRRNRYRERVFVRVAYLQCVPRLRGMDTLLHLRRAGTAAARVACAAVLTAAALLGQALPAHAAYLPDLSISLSDAPDPVAANGTLTYTIELQNPSYTICVRPNPRAVCEPIDVGAAAQNVVVQDT